MKKKISIILTKDISKNNKKNKIIDVKRGYAFNYLIPNNLAEIASIKKVKHLKMFQISINQKQQKEILQAEKNKKFLLNINNLYIYKKRGDNNIIFGSINEKEVIEKITKYSDINLEKKQVTIPLIKKIGSYKIYINLFQKISCEIQINIVPINI